MLVSLPNVRKSAARFFASAEFVLLDFLLLAAIYREACDTIRTREALKDGLCTHCITEMVRKGCKETRG